MIFGGFDGGGNEFSGQRRHGRWISSRCGNQGRTPHRPASHKPASLRAKIYLTHSRIPITRIAVSASPEPQECGAITGRAAPLSARSTGMADDRNVRDIIDELVTQRDGGPRWRSGAPIRTGTEKAVADLIEIVDRLDKRLQDIGKRLDQFGAWP